MTEEATEQRFTRGRKAVARVRSGDVLLVTVLGALVLVFLNFSFSQIFSAIYHPVAGLIVFVVLVEFLWLKSGDRTRIYRLEVDRLRQLRRADEDLLKRAKTLALEAGDQLPPNTRQTAQELARDLEARL